MTPFLRLQPRRQMMREEFLRRHQRFTRADAFVLGFAAGAVLIALTVLICKLVTM